jgi:tRNA U54 and U55 pseudouridine synthase Pus10
MCCESCPLHVDLSKYKTDISHHEEMVQSYYLDIYLEPIKSTFIRRVDDRRDMIASLKSPEIVLPQAL